MKAAALLIFLAFGAISGLALACLLAMAIFDIEERAAARMRQHQANPRGNNQYLKRPGRESRPGLKGRSAEIVAKKIGVKKDDVKAIRAI